MPNLTLKKFNYPDSLIKSYAHWNLLLRPDQPTLGSLVLVCKEPVYQYSEISREAAIEQLTIVKELEEVLKHRFNYDRINYLMLMMVDPAVHFHIIPRYQNPIIFCDRDFIDQNWPKPINLSDKLDLSIMYHRELLHTLRTDFSAYTQINLTEQKQFKRMYTSGCFDIFHQGHLNIIKKTKSLCDYLIVGVSTDDLIIQSKGRPPLIPFEERISIVEANVYVNEVIPQVSKDKQAIVDQYRINAISVGSDWKGKYPPVNCEMVYFDYTPNVSSSVLKQKQQLLN
jgi:glycerol-3-phosphate cytidylyltransferase